MPAIVADQLTKRFGPVLAVDAVSFELAAGSVTGFLGANGAGKSTTLRLLLGLSRPTAGAATIGGVAFADLPAPARTVGAVLEPRFHPGRRARDHLRVLAAAAGIGPGRVDDVLGLVGLAGDGHRRVGGFSLGMRQRLALAAALLGDPGILVLDEPANGLDPEGMQWLRRLLRGFGDEGRTVLVSSHQLAEVAQAVDDVVVIARGRVVAHRPLASLAGPAATYVRTADARALAGELARRGVPTRPSPGGLVAEGDAGAVALAVAASGALVLELRPESTSLEDAYFALTGDSHGAGR